MARKRRMPWTTRRKLAAALWLLVALVVMAIAGWLFYQFVVVYDFEGFTPGTEPLQEFLPEGGYIRESYPPYDPNATAKPAPAPTPRPTAIPLEKYSLLNKRMLLPEVSYEQIGCGLAEFRISEPDDNRAFAVRGWGYIAGLDASKSTVYLVVSAKYGENHRVYLMSKEGGASGILHDTAAGSNLDQADFTGCIRIEDTYASGEYRLGIMVATTQTGSQLKAYARLATDYSFVVEAGKIVGLTKDLR